MSTGHHRVSCKVCSFNKLILHITDKVSKTEENNTEKQLDKIDKQSLVVDGLESGTVIGIAFAAFFIGVLLMAALWFIHTHTELYKKLYGACNHSTV
jgi:hypothetical protein